MLKLLLLLCVCVCVCGCVAAFDSLQSSFIGAIAVGDLVKSTLGPKGMVRMFWERGRQSSRASSVKSNNNVAVVLADIPFCFGLS